jgi:MFS family permease
LLCITALQPSFGKVYTYFNVKWTFVVALIIFEVGSIICAAATSSEMLIVGRAIAGSGGAGLYSGGMTMLAYAIPLRQRTIYLACLSSMFGIASIVGPILGGVFTDRLTWRWCFWINLPFGGLTIVTVAGFFKSPKRDFSHIPFKSKIKEMDLIGASFLIGAIVCLLLALQWGGFTYPWRDSKVWGCLLGFGL